MILHGSGGIDGRGAYYAKALQDAGIRVGKVSVLSPPPSPFEPQTAPVTPSAVSEPSAASMIVTQTPAPGQKIAAGSAVNFEVR